MKCPKDYSQWETNLITLDLTGLRPTSFEPTHITPGFIKAQNKPQMLSLSLHPSLPLTLSTKVFSLSGISNGVVVRTSTTQEQAMLTRGFDAYWSG